MSKAIALKNPTFDSSPLTKDEKSKLIYYEGELFRSKSRVANEYIQHGKILAEAQELLANHSGGIFLSWLESVGIAKSTAYEHIAVYHGFGSIPHAEDLEVQAMKVLTKNEDAKKKALKAAAKGVKVTHAMAKQLVKEAAPKPPKPPKKPKPDPEPPPEPDSDEPDYGPEEPDDPPSRPKGPPKQYPRQHWMKQWDQQIKPLVRLVDKIAHGVGESKCKSQRAIQSQLNAATEEMIEWMK